MVHDSEVHEAMNPAPESSTGDAKLDFWISATETSRKVHQQDLNNLLPILKEDTQKFIFMANQVNARREQEYNSFFSTAEAELEHEKATLQREYTNQLQKPIGASDSEIALRQEMLKNLSASQLEAELEKGDALSRSLLRSSDFGGFLIKAKGINPEKWYELIAMNSDVLEDRLRDAAFGLARVPRLQSSLQRAKAQHEASLNSMHAEIKAAIKKATETKSPAQQMVEDSKVATIADVKRLYQQRGPGFWQL